MILYIIQLYYKIKNNIYVNNTITTNNNVTIK